MDLDKTMKEGVNILSNTVSSNQASTAALKSSQKETSNKGYTLTGHFIRYTLLVMDWTHFAFRTALIRCGIDSTRC